MSGQGGGNRAKGHGLLVVRGYPGREAEVDNEVAQCA